MNPEVPLLDLLVVGGMTIDHLSDGTSAVGGSAIHIARAAGPRGIRIGIVTACGAEVEARTGLDELRGLASLVESKTHEQTTSFRYREGPIGRRLWLEHLGGPVELDATAFTRIPTQAILYAPVADEIPLDALAVWPESAWEHGAILQGWLRSTDEGVEVRPLPLRALRPRLIESLSQFNLLVASREDLLAESEAPFDQLTALRRVFGPGPSLILTDGVDGIWLDVHSTYRHWGLRRHLPVPWRVEVASAVGAGDILAAFLTVRPDETPTSNELWAQSAMRVVAEVLEARAARRGEEYEA
jgi:sugar/nucleoside kinase (ribokinase family)